MSVAGGLFAGRVEGGEIMCHSTCSTAALHEGCGVDILGRAGRS